MGRAPRKPMYSIVLAAGKGRRMRNQTVHKVCFTIGGVPALGLLGAMSAAGLFGAALTWYLFAGRVGKIKLSNWLKK